MNYSLKKGTIWSFQLEWKDIDFERNLVAVNHPEKGSNARILRISKKLANMLNNLPKKSLRAFGDGSAKHSNQDSGNREKTPLENSKTLA